MAKAIGIIEFEYDIPDDPKQRFTMYETNDLEECIEVDRQVNPVSMVSSGVTITRYELKPAPEAK